MRKLILLLFLITLYSIKVLCQKSQVWMIGPMVQFNFSEKKMQLSYGIELAYWNYEHFPYSFDGGLEFGKHKFRIYSEAQTGIGVLGVSLGPVLEIRGDEHKIKLGVQGSGWANYFGGVDLRFRSVGGVSSFSPGLYFKLPLGLESESDGSHHHWDWDD